MKAEHRHDLKTNELAQWIADMPQWFNKNAKVIIYVVVAVAAVAGSYFYKKHMENKIYVQQRQEFTSLTSGLTNAKYQILDSQSKGMDTSINLIQLANQQEDFAATVKDNKMASLALIKSGQAIRTELLYSPKTIGSEELSAQTNKAKELYQNALEKASGDIVLTAEAKFGIALCHEELGQLPEAKAIYEELAGAKFIATDVHRQAAIRLKTLDANVQPVTFKPAPVEVPAQPKETIDPNLITQPAIGAPEANQPK